MFQYKSAAAHHKRIFTLGASVLILAALWLGLTPRTAQAHGGLEVGPYLLVLGWLNEPVIVGERNALVLEITEDGQPVAAAEGSLQLTVLYGSESFIGLLAPTAEPGVYTMDIFPTVRGQYQVQITGSLGDVTLDEMMEPEEVLGGDAIQFPQAQPAPVELQMDIEALEAELQTARTLAYAGIGAGIIGIALSAFALFKRGK